MRVNADGALVVLCVGTLALVGYRSVQPDGYIGRWHVKRSAERSIRSEVSKAWQELRAAGQMRGSERARSVVIEFSDYECPFCRNTEPAVEQWLHNDAEVSVLYVHLPLPIHPSAAAAAAAAICAEREGRFAPFHKRLMSTTEWQQNPLWTREAQAAGIEDTSAFRKCLDARETKARIEAGVRLARQLGIRGTPTFITRNGRKHVGAAEVSALSQLK